MIDSKGETHDQSIAAIATTCSARKKLLPATLLISSNLGKGGQGAVAKEWERRLRSAPSIGQIAAGDLYLGSAFRRVRLVAERVQCPLFILSAGLGLLGNTSSVPAYDLTLSPSATNALQLRVSGRFVASKWWTALQEGPFARPLQDIGADQGRIVISLTQPYAALVGQALSELPLPMRNRLRLLGSGLARHLPPSLSKQLIQYDERLDKILPGIRLDSAARALDHFIGLVATVRIDTVNDDQRRVDTALTGVTPKPLVERLRLTDEALMPHINRLARSGMSASVALQDLRATALIACEERRFRRLYQEAKI